MNWRKKGGLFGPFSSWWRQDNGLRIIIHLRSLQVCVWSELTTFVREGGQGFHGGTKPMELIEQNPIRLYLRLFTLCVIWGREKLEKTTDYTYT